MERHKASPLSSIVRDLNVKKRVCPYCKEGRLNFRDILMLAPRKKIQCSKCHSFISVHWITIIIFGFIGSTISIFCGAMALTIFEGQSLPIDTTLWLLPLTFGLGCILSLPVLFLLYYYLIPLEIKDA